MSRPPTKTGGGSAHVPGTSSLVNSICKNANIVKRFSKEVRSVAMVHLVGVSADAVLSSGRSLFVNNYIFPFLPRLVV